MKVLAICGSPRQGNSEFVLKTMLEQAKINGAKTELVLLRNLNIEHCDGCDKCSDTGKCHIQDDMQPLYEKLYAADVIIFGTPTYFDNVTGRFKDFIDRSNPVGVGRRLTGKKLLAIISGGASLERAERAVETIKSYGIIQKMEFINFLFVKSLNADDASKNKEIIEQCKELANKISK